MFFGSALKKDETEDKSPISPVLKLKPYALIIKILSAELVEKCSSATVKITLKEDSKPKVTKSIKNTNNPVWDQEFNM